ncbi:hypothetical protein HPULCUR_004526 [Helicostylum pulchrum]|uniref:Uncharacterized protein n=1 Tax=Helicostylum pulchrum TaxID=562976 RepID=A0ABP9XYJ1_9FUNG
MDTVLIEIPKERVKRQLYSMEQSLHLARENLHHEPLLVDPIGCKFKKNIPVDYRYHHVALDMTVFQQLLNNNNRILKDIEKFVNCIIEFEDCCVLVTGFDLFAHNQFLTDDCAYGIRPSDISSVPAAKVKHKQNTDKSFTELSIFVGLYELLIVSGYILHNDSISPFLGSSFAKFRFGNTVARNIHVLEAEVPTTKTTRLLNQYFKRCSNKPWGYRCYNSFSKGFYPIVPLDLLNHPSQKHRHMNTHHFASYILALITSVNIIKEADAESLWSLVERLPTYEKIAKTISPKPITFDQLMGVTNNEGG